MDSDDRADGALPQTPAFTDGTDRFVGPDPAVSREGEPPVSVNSREAIDRPDRPAGAVDESL